MWRTIWDIHDLIALNEQWNRHILLIVLITHFMSFAVFVFFGLAKNVYGDVPNMSGSQLIIDHNKSNQREISLIYQKY